MHVTLYCTMSPGCIVPHYRYLGILGRDFCGGYFTKKRVKRGTISSST